MELSTHEDVHFYWLNTEMIGILRQLKSTSTEINRIHHGCPVEIGKSQPEGPPVPVGNEARRVGPPRRASFPTGTVDPRVGIFLSPLGTHDRFVFLHTLILSFYR